jgi:putative ABC transport system permease protein
LAANRVLASELLGVGARDPLTFATVAVVVLGAGVAACWFPARRATRVDPTIARVLNRFWGKLAGNAPQTRD